jgi:hypothetical protein
VFWGTAWIEDTGGTAILAPAAGWRNYYIAPSTTSPTAIPAPSPAPPATYNVTIDGVNVNLEHVLIRLIHNMFPGHTISNNQLNASYLNPTNNAVTLIFNHAALGDVPARSWGMQWDVNAEI